MDTPVKVAIVYYSATGNIAQIAQEMAQTAERPTPRSGCAGSPNSPRRPPSTPIPPGPPTAPRPPTSPLPPPTT
jgi:hypothetical protein